MPAPGGIDPMERAWLEARWAWLKETFGDAPCALPVVLPNTEFFPDHYDQSEEAGAAMFRRIQEQMGLDDATVVLSFYGDDAQPWEVNPHFMQEAGEGAAGLYEHYAGEDPSIRLARQQLQDPTALAATIAHELCHLRLIGDGWTGSEPDEEPLTDLATVFFGLGVFTANSVIRDRNWQEGGLYGWSISRLGYLTQPEFAFALALHARERGEGHPGWASELVADIAQPFRQSLAYLTERDHPPTDPPLDDLTYWRGMHQWDLQAGVQPEEEAGGGRGLGIAAVVAVALLALCLFGVIAPDPLPVHVVNGTGASATVVLKGRAGSETHELGSNERTTLKLRPGKYQVTIRHRHGEDVTGLELTRRTLRVVVLNVAGAGVLLREKQEYFSTRKKSPRETVYEAELLFGAKVHTIENVDYPFQDWPDQVWTREGDRLGALIRSRLTFVEGTPGQVVGRIPTAVPAEHVKRWLELRLKLDPQDESARQALASLEAQATRPR